MVLALPANFPQSTPLATSHCEECGSGVFVQNNDGYIVCDTCGLVREEGPFVTSDPFARKGGVMSSHADRHHGLGTLVGSDAEREQASSALQRGVRLATPDYLTTVLTRGYFAVKKVLCQVNLEQMAKLFDKSMKLYGEFYSHIPRGSHARNVDVLAVVAVYRAAEQVKVFVNMRQLLNTCLPEAHLRPHFIEALKLTSPLCPHVSVQK